MVTKRLFLVLLIIILVPGLLPSANAQEGPKPEAVGLRPDAPPYAVHGPYWVGAQDFVVDPNSERPLTTTVWYPALNPQGLPEDIVYTVSEDCPIRSDFPANTDWDIQGHALKDAPPDLSGGPYPLVIFSHGAGGWRQLNAYLVEHLASYGFVIIAADHPGELPFPEGYWPAYITRPADIGSLIDYAAAIGGVGGALAGLIDLDRIGIAGHSLGGETALALGGAQLDWGGFSVSCAEHPELDVTGMCPTLMAHGPEMAAMLGLTVVPDALWPTMRDPRVSAVVAMAPGAFLFGEAGMNTLNIPLLALAGSADPLLPPEWNAPMAYEAAGSTQKALVLFDSGGHMLFAQDCNATPWAVKLGLAEAICSDPVWDMDLAHDLINHFTTAFLLTTLKGDADAADALTPDAVAFPGITYEAQGF